MAKSAKHKKQRKQEKAKTQLKGGLKTLGKAQNVIEPKLQSKKIILREQLKSAPESEVSTRRKQNIADVLGSLSHHNTNTKVEALSGLYELITTGNNILIPNLGRIVDKVGLMTSDSESAVRKENLRVAEAVFNQVSEDQLQPFWNLLLTHLKCTLTDLNPVVRQSCLSFISLLVATCPNLVFASSSTILPAVLNLISNTAAVNSVSSGTTTRLKLDIGDKAADIKERTRVLAIIVSCLDLKSASNASDRSTVLDRKCSQGEIRTCSNSDKHPIHLNLYYPFGYEDEVRRYNGRHISSKCDSISAAGGVTQQQPRSSSQFMSDFIKSCFPVLCETWIEVAPSSKLLKTAHGTSLKSRQAELKENVSGASQLNRTALDVLQCVVNVMIQVTHQNSTNWTGYRRPVWNEVLPSGSAIIKVAKPEQDTFEGGLGMSEKLVNDLKKSFGPDLQKFFFNFLPFSCTQDSQRQSTIKINLQLFNVAAQFRLFDRQLMDKFEKYVGGMIHKGIISSEFASLVLETASLVRNPRIGDVSTKFIVFSLQSGCRSHVYKFLFKILATSGTPEDVKFALTIEWGRVAQILMEELLSDSLQYPEEIVEVLTLIAMRNLVELRPTLQQQLPVISSKFLSGTNKLLGPIIRLFYYADSNGDLLQAVTTTDPGLGSVLSCIRSPCT